MARKSKEFRELFHQDSVGQPRTSRYKSIRQRELASFEDFKQELKGKTNKDAVFVENASDLGKISETLIQFVLPFLEKTKTYQERLRLFQLAVTAWNISLLPEEERDEFLASSCQELSQSDPQNMETIEYIQLLINQFIERKLQFFAEEKRSIDDFKLTERFGRIHVSVASSLRL